MICSQMRLLLAVGGETSYCIEVHSVQDTVSSNHSEQIIMFRTELRGTIPNRVEHWRSLVGVGTAVSIWPALHSGATVAHSYSGVRYWSLPHSRPLGPHLWQEMDERRVERLEC